MLLTLPSLKPTEVVPLLTARGVRGAVFDFGGVISRAARDATTGDWELYSYCAELGISREVLEEAWRTMRHLWDGGFISFAEMYRRIFAAAGKSTDLTPEVLAELWQWDAESWIRYLRSETLTLMQALKQAGFKLGILSNMAPDFYEQLFVPRTAAYRAVVDMEVISGLERLYKPEKPIYDLAQQRMGLAPHELIFFDDTPANVEAAVRYGWHAAVYPAGA